MGTKKEAFASPSSGSNPCFEVTTTGSRFEPSTSKMLPNLQTFLLCVQILISTSVSKEEFLMRRGTYKTLLHSGVPYVYRSVFECKVTGFPDTLQASLHPFSVILTWKNAIAILRLQNKCYNRFWYVGDGKTEGKQGRTLRSFGAWFKAGDGLSGRWLKWLKRRILHILIYSMCAPYMCHMFPAISFASSFYISSASSPKIPRLFNLEREKVGPSSK